MKKVILLPNTEKDPSFALSLRVLEVLRGFCTCVYTESGNDLLLDAGAVEYPEGELPRDAELLIVLGGDGTMLHAATDAARFDIPLLGINMGRLGYLASLDPTEIDSLSSLATDTYTEQARMLLDVRLQKENGEEEVLGCALNDMVIDGGGHLADLRLFEKQSYLDYRADGLIVATPTGSTAYSLSAGGAVLDETMDALCVTPICPRSFFSRSLVFPSDAALRIVNMSTRGDSVHISLDGSTAIPLAARESVLVSRSPKRVRLITLKPRRLLEVLSTKMNTQHF
ncbi:MAG: NAD(+)/NADH kinase [Ruminococcaceae bacterium]|nr:NAD(+)/NADH kinase [Oscillospiraceae bacterium]